MSDLARLTAVSPLDGRYRNKTEELAHYFSELALITYRVRVEVEYVQWIGVVAGRKTIDPILRKIFKNIVRDFDVKEAEKVLRIEAKIHHDVKAVEYYLQEKLVDYPDWWPWIHWGLTSEDTNSCAYGLMFKHGLLQVIFPALETLIHTILMMAGTYRSVPMLARTHGQPAIPTTMGKELFNIGYRLQQEYQQLIGLPIEGKLTGAVGNFNAMASSFPKNDWVTLTDGFVSDLGLQPNHFTTQILPSDSLIRIFDSLRRMNSILLGFDQDIWRYISDGYFRLKVVEVEVGSSTMPQKVNPIDFENSEGNLGLANALLTHFSEKLPISRLQRDLSDSTVKRNIGSALAYCLLGYSSCVTGLGKLQLDESTLANDLAAHEEVIAEGIQTILRSQGEMRAYEQLKALTRGKQWSKVKYAKFVDDLPVPLSIKQQLRALSPATYVGLAAQLVADGIKHINNEERKA